MRVAITMRALCLVVAAALAAACSSAPATGSGAATPDAGTESRAGALDDTLRVELGRTVSADRGRLSLTFLARLADSRCPANAVCVWMGDAAVRIGARVGNTAVEREIHTALEPLSLTVDRYTVTVVGLLPYPGTAAADSPGVTPTVLLRVVRR